MITGLDNASKMISECPKPVVAYIAGACASAHFLAGISRRQAFSWLVDVRGG